MGHISPSWEKQVAKSYASICVCMYVCMLGTALNGGAWNVVTFRSGFKTDDDKGAGAPFASKKNRLGKRNNASYQRVELGFVKEKRSTLN